MSFAGVNKLLLDILKNLAISPYRLVYHRNTHDPIVAVLDTNSSTDCKIKLEIWFHLKLREAQYVQVAVGPPTLLPFPHSKTISPNHIMPSRVRYCLPRQQPRFPGQQSPSATGLALRSGTRLFCSR